MNSRRKRQAALLFAGVAAMAGAVVWLWPREAWKEYVSPPMGKAKWRVRVLVPAGWEADPSGSGGGVTVKPVRPFAWAPAWLRNRLCRSVSPADSLGFTVWDAPGLDGTGSPVWVSVPRLTRKSTYTGMNRGQALEEHVGYRQIGDPLHKEMLYVTYRRETEAAYRATFPVIQQSFRVTHD